MTGKIISLGSGFQTPKLDISFEFTAPTSYVVSIYFQKYLSKLDGSVSQLGVNMFKHVSNHKVEIGRAHV